MTAPSGFTLRHPVEEDLADAQAVLDAAETADAGEPRRHEHDLAREWRDPRTRPDLDWWVAAAPDGSIAGVAWLDPQEGGQVTADHYVHPDFRRLGLGDALLDAIEARAAELPAAGPDGRSRHLIEFCEDSDGARRASLAGRGFAPTRQYYEMTIDLRGRLPAPGWPAGIVSRAFRRGWDEHAVWETDEEAFAEHHLFEPRSFAQWRLRHLEGSRSDTSLWWLAWDGDELAGFVIAVAGEFAGLVDDLAVRRPWRGRGIGRALLLTSLALLRERGQAVARLYVDAENATGALRVYEDAGMRVSRRFDVMQRPLVG